MTISSMTGFARASGILGGNNWCWEIKSVNNRGLDLRCRLHGGLDRLEPAVRAAVARRFHRGAVTLHLNLTRSKTNLEIKINEKFLNAVLVVADDLARRIKAGPPTVESLLAMRGVADTIEVEESEENRKEFEVQLLATLNEGLVALENDRRAEGGRLAEILDDQINVISTLTSEAASLVFNQPAALKSRLQQQISELVDKNNKLPEDRLLHEVALLAIKADVREELDRLTAHVEATKELLEQGGAIGRRLDFLAQEFNREANTLCSKSQDASLTKIGIELKTVIDQFREQAQNIE